MQSFQTTVEGLLHASFYGDEDLCSERMVKRIHYLLEIILKLQESSSTALVLPAPDRIFNLQQRIKSKVPVFTATECRAKNKKGESHFFFMNKPSDYMKNLVATPGMVKEITALPDFTPERKLDLNHGDKWKYHANFQTPMMTKSNHDYRAGDLVKDNYDAYWLLNKFVTKSGVLMAECFPVFNDEFVGFGNMAFLADLHTNFAVSSDKLLVPLDNIVAPISKVVNFRGNGCTVKYGGNGEPIYVYDTRDPCVARLWSGNSFCNRFKRVLPSSTLLNQKFMKVVVCPIILWSDDKFGNKSKQYNVFDSYLMYIGDMSLEKRSRRENTMFFCTSDKNLQVVDMLSAIVDDLKQLEQGIEV